MPEKSRNIIRIFLGAFPIISSCWIFSKTVVVSFSLTFPPPRLSLFLIITYKCFLHHLIPTNYPFYPLKNMAAFEGRPLMVAVEHEEEDFNDHEEASGSGCGCGCFRVFGLRWWEGHEDEGKGLPEQKGQSWVSGNLRKMKEVSEVIAGPKWKTFIRKISGYGKKQRKNRFQYDEHSYALNFNSGAQSEDEDMPPTFSARFTAPFTAGRRQPEL